LGGKAQEEVREKKSSVVDLVSSFSLFMLCYLVLLMAELELIFFLLLFANL
jgi:hypothetical protein